MFRLVVGILSVFTGISGLQVALSPHTPIPKDPDIYPEEIPGVRAAEPHIIPGSQSRNWSLSRTRVYSMPPNEAQQEPSKALTLLLTGITVRKEEHLQIALVTKGNPSLEMTQRRLYETRDGNEYAIGKVRSHNAIQSCLVPDKGIGVTQERLGGLTIPPPFYRRSPIVLLQRFVGLQPNRDYDCILLTLISPETGQTDRLLATWRELLLADG